MKEKLLLEQMQLLTLIKESLLDIPEERPCVKQEYSREQWENILQLAKSHAVLPLLYEALKKNKSLPRDLFETVQTISKQTVLQFYKLLYLTNYIVKLLEKESVSVLVLKGASTAALYPIPELRKSGDVDLLVAKREDLKKTCEILEKHFFLLKEKQLSNHHLEFESKDGIVIEIHTALAEPFDNQKVNNLLKDISIEYYNHIQKRDIIGSRLPVPEDAYHAFYLLLHMLQHFLRAGFGLKLLCDWVIFWNRDISDNDKENFQQLVRSCGLYGFLERVTAVCVHFLGLEETKVNFLKVSSISKEETMEFIMEILEAEEFGKSGKDRMVVLRGTSPIDYVREFHHQMCLNYKKAHKIVIIWPMLWVSTLVIFLNNNKKIRKTSGWGILKKARSRSRSKKAMNLFLINKKTMNRK